MNHENVTTDGGRGFAEEADGQGPSLNDSLRSLRLRRYEQESYTSPAEPVEEAVEEEDLEDPEDLDEADDDDSSGEQAVVEEAQRFFSEAFDDLGQEVRRMGREMFRTTRVAERNQELFDEAINEIRQLSSNVALIPEQHNDTINAATFDAKADLCRELLRMSDTLRASLAAADDLIHQFQAKAGRPQQGLAFRFSATRRLSDSLTESIAAMKQWRTGQQLLAERLQAILLTAGVREIETAGRAFDPDLHRAVSVAERNDVAPGTIVGEELKGYTLEDRILRYAEVIVAKHG
ncbi:MAG: nucleotide exchange factor GrpE [Blastocatellia bacterium]